MWKRTIILIALSFIWLAADRSIFGQSEAKPKAAPVAKQACRFSIIGMWRLEGITPLNSTFLSFTSDGWVTLLGRLENALPQDFEMITQVAYKLDPPTAPKRIEFTASRGNEVFPTGTTTMEITEYGEDSFTTLDKVSEQKTRWVREQTQRYFLTFAARSGPPPQGGSVCAMWTVMDGRKTEIEALGIQLIADEAGKSFPVFDALPEAVYNRIIEQSDNDKKRDKDENPFLRLEVTAAEFETTHNIFLSWAEQVKTHTLAQSDPYLNGMEFLKRVAESLNQCGEKIKLRRVTPREQDEMIAKHQLPQFLLEYISAMRKQNDELHIDNVVFPWGWRPTIQTFGQ
jgi:hypothetical protein